MKILCRVLSTFSPLSSLSWRRLIGTGSRDYHSQRPRLFPTRFFVCSQTAGRCSVAGVGLHFLSASSGAQRHHYQHFLLSASVHVHPHGFSRGLRPPGAQHLSQLGALRAPLRQAQILRRNKFYAFANQFSTNHKDAQRVSPYLFYWETSMIPLVEVEETGAGRQLDKSAASSL